MKQNSIGRFIHILRTRNNISQGRLSKGLCSIATLSRIELGERIPDKFLMDALFQRLGKSPDKFEVLLAEKDYSLYEKRKDIEKALFLNDYALANELLLEYQHKKECKGSLHEQFVLKVSGILDYEDRNDIDQALEKFLAALKCTLPHWKYGELRGQLLSLEEIDLFLLISMSYAKKNKTYDVIVRLKELIEYIENGYTDEEEKVKVYPKAAYLLVKFYCKKGNYLSAEDLCEKAIDILTSNGVIVGLADLLLLFVEILNKNGKDVKEKKVRLQLASLLKVYEEYDIKLLFPSDTAIIVKNIQNDIYLMGELIKANRVTVKISQENLSSDICAAESLSRIESGKRAPRNKNYEAIAGRLGIAKDIYNTTIEAETYDILETKRDIDRMLFGHQIENAWASYMRLKKLLTAKTNENKQYLSYMEAILHYQAKKIGTKTALKKMEKALEYTLKNYKDIALCSCILSRQEAFILNQIAILTFDTGQKKQAIDILRSVSKSYENSKIDLKYHSVQYLLVLQNLSMYLEEDDQLEAAIEICDKAIKLALKCAKGNFLSRFITNKAFTLERIDMENQTELYEKTCRLYYQQAYSLSELMKDPSTHSIVGEYYKLKYNESADSHLETTDY
ncbi:helix-turn-helix domain-containing protein [Anaerocolumna sp. AGMB13020]|uniref:helix-turn-helix domain-containing protein n=1 Tax=Anaerocolumna sp. AGMB13020 TaxID=3081750 RepID=UPI0029545CEF|nr:helix-turn-helix domain-containing protein [Anaerocolumna sp. AGMB13020]WOO36801.1 helix-turn-helix domain-containing protein [Anaerocolumna sp. AGMB13020]